MPNAKVVLRPDPHAPEHYIPLANQPGEFVWLPKNDLQVDFRYQRQPLNDRMVERISRNWNWIACGTLTVSFREQGTPGWFVIDGWHRREAVILLPEITQLPCMVFGLESVTAEAVGFLSANVDRRPIGPIKAFKAELLTGAPRALLVDELAREAGRIVGVPADKTHLSCVTALARYAAIDTPALRRVWPLIIELTRDHTLPSSLVQAIWACERRMPFGQSLTDPRWRTRLVKIGLDQINRDIRASIALRGVRTPSVLSDAIENVLNRGMKSRKLQLRGPRGG